MQCRTIGGQYCTGLLVAPTTCPKCKDVLCINCVIRMGDEQRKVNVSCQKVTETNTCGEKLTTAKKITATFKTWNDTAGGVFKAYIGMRKRIKTLKRKLNTAGKQGAAKKVK